jgi:peptide/nickel transport system substrate-binding protein
MLSSVLTKDGISVIDDYTIKFELTESFAPFLSFLPWWYVMNPVQVMANEVDGDLGQKWLTDNDAGSGPFKMKRWEHGVLYEVEADVDYWKGWPQDKPLAGVIYKLIRESSTQKAALQRGEADIVEGLSPEDFDLVEKLPGVRVENHSGMTTFGIKFNVKKAPLDDINLRKAVAYAFDYDALLKIYNGNAKLQTSPFPFATQGHVDVPNIPRQDLAKANEFLIGNDFLPPFCRQGFGN